MALSCSEGHLCGGCHFKFDFRTVVQQLTSFRLTPSGATENAGVEKAGAGSRSGKCRSKSYGTPNRDYFGRILSYLNLVC